MKRLVTAISMCVLLVGCSSPFKKAGLESIPLIPRTILFGNPEKFHARISPDGFRVAYLAPSNGILNVWVKTLGKNDDHAVTQSTKHGIRGFTWANNKHILFTHDSSGNEIDHIYQTNVEKLKTVDMTPFQGVCARILHLDRHFPDDVLITMNKKNPKLFDVYRLNLVTGALKLIAQNTGSVDVWCTDTHFAIRAAVTANHDGSTDLLVRDDTKSAWQKKLTWNFDDSLAGSVPPGGSRPISFSRDGTFLYLIDSMGANAQRLIKMNLTTGTREVVAFDNQCDVDSVVLNPDTNEPDFVAFYRERKAWKALNPEREKDLAIILASNKGDLVSIDRCSDDTQWIVYFENDIKPGAYYLYDRRTKKIEFLFYDRPALANYTLSPTQPIAFTSRDGLTIHGYLTRPPISDTKKQPLILFAHCGPWYRDTWGCSLPFNVTAQLFANRGYACLQVNFRGSTGYGKSFLSAGDKEWAGKMHNDLIDACQWAINEGVADPKKIAIYGESYGGYAALVGATFTPNTFCCAVDCWGPSNLVTLVHSIVEFRPMGKAKLYNRVGNPETEADFLKSRSPLFKADQIKIPVFVVHGGNDPRVKQEESEQIVAAMKARNLDYQYMLFPEEGHGISSPMNRFKLAVAIEKFLAKHLGGRVEQ